MKTEKFEVVSRQDGLVLSAMKVQPDAGEILGVVQLVHGMSEYKERYLPFMEYLADHGYASVIHDHRGHGSSVRSPEDLGYFYSRGDQALVSDLHQMIQNTKRLFPALPVHLVGHSMGSLVVRCYLQQHDDEVASLMISGCVGRNAMMDVGLGLVKAVKVVRGERYRSQRITELMFGSFNKNFAPVRSENDWICSDRRVVEEYDQNPLCGFTFTVNGYETLLKLMKRCYRKAGWQVKQPELPIYMISGADDPCMNGLNGLLDAADFLRKQGYTHVQTTAIPGMRHEILNELGKEAVYDRILAHMTAAC